MHILFAAMRLYPFWAVPAAMILWELFFYYRRKGHKNQYLCGAAMVLVILGTLGWIVGRGDLHSDEWTRSILGQKR